MNMYIKRPIDSICFVMFSFYICDEIFSLPGFKCVILDISNKRKNVFMYKCARLKKEENIQISFLYTCMCKQYRMYQNV